MTDLAEQLIILNDLSAGLLNRAYYLLRYTPASDSATGDSILTPDICKYGGHLAKRWPNTVSETDIAASKYAPINDVFIKQSSEIQKLLESYYITLLHLTDFTVQARACVDRCAARYQMNVNDLNLCNHITHDITHYILTLYSNYVKIHLLLDQCIEQTPVRAYLSLYVRAYTLATRTQPDRYSDIQQLIAKFATRHDILKQLQGLATNHSAFIAQLLQNHYPSVVKYRSMVRQTVVQKRMFNLLEYDSRLLAQHNTAYDKVLHEHSCVEQLCRHAQWLFFICPAALQSPDAQQLLRLTLADTGYAVIHRDVTVDIIYLYEWLFNYFKINKFKLSKHVKLLTDLRSTALDMVTLHSDIRAYYGVELQAYYELFKQKSKYIATRVQNIFALLTAARNELMWYMAYLQSSVGEKASKQIQGVRSQMQENEVVVYTLYHYALLVRLIKDNRHRISEYMHRFLVTVDTQCVKQQYDRTQMIVNSDTLALIDHISSNLAGRTIDDSYEAIRLNYYRLSSNWLSTRCSEIDKHTANQCISAIYDSVQHCKLIDSVSLQIKNYASLQSLYWYRSQLYNIYLTILPPSTPVSNKQPTQPLFTQQHTVLYTQCAYLQLYHDGAHNVHRLYPGEQQIIGSDIKSFTDRHLKRSMQTLEQLIDQLIAARIDMQQAQLDYLCVTDRLLPNTAKPYMQAGSESFAFSNETSAIRHITLLSDALNSALRALDTFDVMSVYNVQFCVSESVTDMLTKYLIQYYTSMWFDTTTLNSTRSSRAVDMTAPTVMKPLDVVYRQWTVVKQVAESVASVVRADIHTVLHNVISTCTTSRSIQTSAAAPPAIDQIAQYYTNLVCNDCYSNNIIYNAHKRCFQPITVQPGVRSVASVTDTAALHQLTDLIGVDGIKAISSALMTVVEKTVQYIKAVSDKHAGVLSQLISGATDISSAAGQINPSDIEQLVQQLVIAGQALQLRNDIMIHNPAHTITDDTDLIALMNKYSSISLTSTLPVMCGMTMLSGRWKQVIHTSNTNALTYNLHLTGVSIPALVHATIQASDSTLHDNTSNVVWSRLMDTCNQCVLYGIVQNSTMKQSSSVPVYVISCMIRYTHQLTQGIVTEYESPYVRQLLPHSITDRITLM